MRSNLVAVDMGGERKSELTHTNVLGRKINPSTLMVFVEELSCIAAFAISVDVLLSCCWMVTSAYTRV